MIVHHENFDFVFWSAHARPVASNTDAAVAHQINRSASRGKCGMSASCRVFKRPVSAEAWTDRRGSSVERGLLILVFTIILLAGSQGLGSRARSRLGTSRGFLRRSTALAPRHLSLVTFLI